jgi:D-xylose 1-dehydrogenase (NADP+, D-xylono-1,5-lactone-forming)
MTRAHNALRWGILSTARINRTLIPAIRASPRNTVDAVASRDVEKARAYAAEWQIPAAFGSYEALLASPDIDAVYVSLPNNLHAEYAIKAAQAGKHVLVEKPIALTVEDVDAIAAAAQRHGVVITEGYIYRHHVQTQQVKQVIASGQLGEIRLLRSSFSFQLQAQHHIRLNPALGGGALWDIGCYPISYMQYLLDAAPSALQGSADIGASGVDEQFAATLRFGPHTLGVIDVGMRTGYRATFEIVGSAGMLSLPRPFKPTRSEPILFGSASDALAPLPLTAESAADAIELPLASGEVIDMACAVLDGTPPRIALAESRRVVATIQALLRTALS